MYSNTQSISLSPWDVITAALGRSASPVQNWIRAATFTLPLAFLAAVLLQPWAEPKWMFLDPLTAAQLSGDCCHTYYGFISNLGVMAWSATAAVCLFAALLLAVQKRAKPLVWFAASAGLLTGWLALDDAFLVHEVVFPSFGIPQNAVLGLYLVLGGLYGLASWRTILRHDWLMLFIAGGALALSMVVDTVFHSLLPSLVYLEDSAKFFGICCWASFHISTMAALLSSPAVNLDRRTWLQEG
ncbi:MAG: hypothetical protein GY948_13385 [Alphaproteobacteria bacterium]|nr:hypothetical protein [Alphaproteobacteria bacterium]